jgi:beta-phosphoglucomutase family hydrolase
MNSPSWGAIFDWDGVIIDSSAHHNEAWERLAAEEHRELPEGHFKTGFGRKNEVIIPEILKWTSDPGEVKHLGLRKEELYREVMAEAALEPLPGVWEFLQSLHAAGIPRAVGSSGARQNIDLALAKIGLAGLFDAIITGEDVKIGKPNPEVFLKAAAAIHREPTRCVVFEDAQVGIQAAKAGGMRVIGIATTHPVDELTAADRAVVTLHEVTVGQVAEWFIKEPSAP